jgi:hypothetical protein
VLAIRPGAALGAVASAPAPERRETARREIDRLALAGDLRNRN